MRISDWSSDVCSSDLLDCFAVVAVGPQFLAEPAGVLRNQAVGGAEDGAGRAVVLFEADRLAAAEILVETQHVVDARATPAVDRLVVIADREQHAAVAGERDRKSTRLNSSH